MDLLNKWQIEVLNEILSLTTILPFYYFLPFLFFSRAPIQIQRDHIINQKQQKEKTQIKNQSESKYYIKKFFIGERINGWNLRYQGDPKNGHIPYGQ